MSIFNVSLKLILYTYVQYMYCTYMYLFLLVCLGNRDLCIDFNSLIFGEVYVMWDKQFARIGFVAW